MARQQTEQSLTWLRNILETPAPQEGSGDWGDICAPRYRVFDGEQLKGYADGSPEKARWILSAMLGHGPAMLENVQRAHSRADTEGVLRAVHDLRGLTQVVGAYSAAQVCLRVELMYDSGAPDARHDLMVDLDYAMTPLFDAMREYLRSEAA